MQLENYLCYLFRSSERIVIFDVGAFDCSDSIHYAQQFCCAEVHAFEPLPANIAKARERLSSACESRIMLYQVALSDVNGEVEFHVSSGDTEDAALSGGPDFGVRSSSLLVPREHLRVFPFIKFDEKISVACVRGYDFCRAHGISRIDFLHLDVQGAELNVLEGIDLSRIEIGAIWLEVSTIEYYSGQPLLGDIVRFFHRHRFRLVFLDLPGTQGNALFVSWRLLLCRPRALSCFVRGGLQRLWRRVS